MCRRVATRLEKLKQGYVKNGTKIEFIIVNKIGTEKNIRSLTKRVSFDVHQDTKRTKVWRTLRGKKDDILVYDECGFLAQLVRHPFSKPGYNFIDGALRNSVRYNSCSCSLRGAPEAI